MVKQHIKNTQKEETDISTSVKKKVILKAKTGGKYMLEQFVEDIGFFSDKLRSSNRQELKPVVEVPGPGTYRAKTMVG